MEGYVQEPLGAKGALICRDRVRDVFGLVVHDDGEQVVAVGEAVASRLADEDTESRIVLLDKKKAGENVPGTWKPS